MHGNMNACMALAAASLLSSCACCQTLILAMCRERVEGLFGVARAAVMGVVNFTVSIPGKFAGVLKMSSAERGEMYRGWWATAKKEAYHYWVRLLLAQLPVWPVSMLLSQHA